MEQKELPPITGANQEVEYVNEIIEETEPAHVFIDIPSKTLTNPPPDFVKLNMTCSPDPTSVTNSTSLSAREKPSITSLISKVSFKFRSQAYDVEKANFMDSGVSSSGTQENPPLLRSLPLKKILTRTSSLPVIRVIHSNSESILGSNIVDCNASPEKKHVQQHIRRSHSMPDMKISKTFRRIHSAGGMFRVIPSASQVVEANAPTSDGAAAMDSANIGPTVDGGQDHIPEEEAVCRICMVELSEGGDTLKLECSCKGELSLAHQECALKWFLIKGNKTCDVCKEEVQNLPVTILRVRSTVVYSATAQENTTPPPLINRCRACQDVPILVSVGTIAYFLFLEHLLVPKLGVGAIAIALPFSCALGLLASLTSSNMVVKRNVWIYAIIQYSLVVMFAHIFYSLLHMQPVLAVLLAAFAGFGLTMFGKNVFTELLKMRRRYRAWSERRRGLAAVEERGESNPNPSVIISVDENR